MSKNKSKFQNSSDEDEKYSKHVKTKAIIVPQFLFEQKNVPKCTPKQKQLNDAISNNNTELVKLLVEQGATFSAFEVPNALKHPQIHDMSHSLHVALASASTRMIAYLHREHKVNYAASLVCSSETLKHCNKKHVFDGIVACMQQKFASTMDTNYNDVVQWYCFLFSMVKKQLNRACFSYMHWYDEDAYQNVHIADMTYLHMAAWHKNSAAFEALLRCGAQYDAKCFFKSRRNNPVLITATELYPLFESFVQKYAILNIWQQAKKKYYCDVTVLN